MAHRLACEDQRITAQDVIDICTLLRQYVDARQIAGGTRETLVDDRPVDDQHRVPAECCEPCSQHLGFSLGEMGGIDYHELALVLLGRKRDLEAKPAHLFLQIECVRAHHRPEDPRTATELRRAQAALAGAAGTLLLVRFLGRSADLADPLCLVGARAAFCQLPIDDAGEDVAADGNPENLVGEFDVPDLLVVEVAHDQLHWEASPSGLSAGNGPPRKAAGNGSPSGALRLAASLTST